LSLFLNFPLNGLCFSSLFILPEKQSIHSFHSHFHSLMHAPVYSVSIGGFCWRISCMNRLCRQVILWYSNWKIKFAEKSKLKFSNRIWRYLSTSEAFKLVQMFDETISHHFTQPNWTYFYIFDLICGINIKFCQMYKLNGSLITSVCSMLQGRQLLSTSSEPLQFDEHIRFGDKYLSTRHLNSGIVTLCCSYENIEGLIKGVLKIATSECQCVDQLSFEAAPQLI